MIFMDLLGESPIGAWATPDRPWPKISDRRKQGPEPLTNAGAVTDAPARTRQWPVGKDAPQEFQEVFGRPRRRCLDFLLLIGGDGHRTVCTVCCPTVLSITMVPLSPFGNSQATHPF